MDSSSADSTFGLGTIVPHRLTVANFRLTSGDVLPQATIAYETYGRLAADKRNAVLITHGYTSSAHAAGLNAGGEPGWWDNIIGPGKAINTDRVFAIASNMLGSSFGSTGPGSIDPRTGKPYGPDFPEITLADIVNLQKALLDHVGIPHLIAVAGISFGGYQAFQWGVSYPDFMDGLVPVVTAPQGRAVDLKDPDPLQKLLKDPNWNGGRFYDRGGVFDTLADVRYDFLQLYGLAEQLEARFPSLTARQAELRRQAEAWARAFDANSLFVLRRAASRFSAESELGKIRAKVLYVLSSTDKLFPPSLAPAVMAKLKAAGVDAEYVEIETALGHLASNPEAAKWAPRLKAFMAALGA